MLKKYSEAEVLSESLKYFDGDEMAASVWMKKYCLRDNEDNLLELTPKDMHHRLAREFARIEKNKFKKPLTEEEIFNYFDNFKYIVPQGSPMSAIGNTYQIESTGNCFVVKSPYDSYGGILYTDQQLVQLMKRRCGVGSDLSTLRPKGETVLNAAKTTDGIGVFMERYSNTCREVAQNGRSGAEILLLSVQHPEIVTFINMKRDKTKVTGANISVKITDEFMTAVKNNDDFLLQWPVDRNVKPKVTVKISAKEIWDNIITNVWEGGEPGVLFWDTAIRNSLSNQYGVKDDNFYDIACNPCFAGSEYLLTTTGYKRFNDLYKSGEKNTIISDARITYTDSGKETPSNWKINNNVCGIIPRNASEVFLTKKNSDLVKVETDIGFDVVCTPDHHFATPEGMVEAKNLLSQPDQPSKEILVTIPTNSWNLPDTSIIKKLPTTIEEIDAFLMGLIAGGGCFNKKSVNIDVWGDDKLRILDICKNSIDILFNNHKEYINEMLTNGWDKKKLSPYYIADVKKSNKIRITSLWLSYYLNKKYNFNKNTKLVVPTFVMNNSSTTIGRYYIAAFVYCGGTITTSEKKSCCSIRISQSNIPILKQLQLMLHSNGMLFKLHQRRKAHLKEIKGKICSIKPQYELISICGSHYHYAHEIGVINSDKEIKLNNYLSKHKTRIETAYQTAVKSVRSLEIKEDVYCIKEDVGRNIVVNGCSVRRCGEIIMGADSCRLMVMNLWSYVEKPFTTNAKFDYEKFTEHTKVAQRLMDDLLDLEIEHIERIIKKVDSDPEPEYIKTIERDMWKMFLNNCKNGRRTGLGCVAIGDVFAGLGVRYGSKESIELTDKIYKTFAIASMTSSCLIAKEIGTFPLYDATIEKNNLFLNRLLETSSELKDLHKKYGRRNVSLTTSSPTGTLSMLTQTTSGIEPAFSVEYKRRRKIMANENIKATFIDKTGDKWTEYSVYHKKFEMWKQITGKNKFEDSPYFKSTANDVDWEASVDIQATAQKWISHSLSKTVNIPENATKELIENIYFRAYEKGCKGITVYRDKSRDGVLINKDDKPKDEIKKTDAPKRPKELPCDIYNVKITKKLDKIRHFDYLVMVGIWSDGNPYEIFCVERNGYDIKSNKGKITKESRGRYHLTTEDGTEIKDITKDTTEVEDSLTRMVSTALRHGVAIQYIVDQLGKAEGEMFGVSKCISRSLKKYIKEGTKGGTCDKCGEKLVFENGCFICKGCGASRCG